MNLKKLNIFLLLLLFVTTAQSVDAKDLENNHKYNFYTGTFDVIDKEGDDQTTLFGVEHKNEDLFRNTFLGKFSPLTGAFMTGNESMYLYSGIQAEYNLGFLNVIPSIPNDNNPIKSYQSLLILNVAKNIKQTITGARM